MVVAKKPLEPQRILLFLFDIIYRTTNTVIGNYFNQQWTWKRSFRSYQFLTFVLVTTLCYARSGYQYRNSLTELVFSVCLIMLDVMALQRIVTWVNNRPQMFTIKDFLFKFTARWEQEPESCAILLWYYRLLRKGIIGMSILMVVNGTLLCVAPVLYYFITGEMIVVLQCFIPYVDHKTHPGFEIHLLLHARSFMYLFAGLISSTIFMLLLLVQNCRN